MVQGTGKFEELVVSSRDIAASTAQLVSLAVPCALTDMYTCRGRGGEHVCIHVCAHGGHVCM